MEVFKRKGVGETMRITQVIKIEDTEGKYGPQKRITVNDETGKMVSGWCPLERFNPEDWVVGGSPDCSVSQNGKYWNFKMTPKTKPASPSVDGEALNRILEGVKSIYRKLEVIEKVLEVNVVMVGPGSNPQKETQPSEGCPF